jgi:hypothetical protein
VAVVALLFVLFYFLYLKARLEVPLHNERIIGHVVIVVGTKGIGIIHGLMTTARQTMERHYAELIQNETNPDLRRTWEEDRKFVLDNNYICAIKSDDGDKILLFDQNPEDQKFLEAEPAAKDLYLHGVQDCAIIGERNGFDFLHFKLNPTTKTYTDDERKSAQVCGESIMLLRDAAYSVKRINVLETMIQDKDRAYEKVSSELGQKSALLDKAVEALHQKPLSTEGEYKPKGEWREALNKWFSWPQALTGLLAYIVAPVIIPRLGWPTQPPAVTYATAFITVIGFFLIPILTQLYKAIFKR